MKNTNSNTKSFTFQLAAKQSKTDAKSKQWQMRDGVTLAGCTGPDARASQRFSYDGGVYC